MRRKSEPSSEVHVERVAHPLPAGGRLGVAFRLTDQGGGKPPPWTVPLKLLCVSLLVALLQVARDRQAAATCDDDSGSVVFAGIPSIGKGPFCGGWETVTKANARPGISVESCSGWGGRNGRIEEAIGRREAREVEVNSNAATPSFGGNV